ncbi:hypothetical protein RHE_PA00111 (plasmid) [Rhizobium etli CFN 42]|uniref:Uncharacterized protein n=1 Tax=Rhizobium etli (strain ATCC 51251 / DSM 11541 / JCM 21823 / NBRC 15573 / CFN 42) TaxID=347834 RepID=Q2K2J8_RHIEC|nr:hypothetical protein RHE_PA00111 [Rhizobium etli CFN 42]
MLFREEWAHRAQGKKVLEGRCGKTIEAKPVFRSDMPHRAREGRGLAQWRKEYDDGSRAPTACRTLATAGLPPCHMSKSNVRKQPNKGAALPVLRAIVVLANPRLEDLCVRSQSRLPSKSGRPGSSNRSTGKPGSGANWTSRLILTRSPRPSLNRCRPLARPTTDTDGPQAASRSPAVSGCRECRKLTARCACAAAWKIARLSSLRTLSQESRYEA